ncbi:MAG: TIM barrel protein [Acidobacteria bacterium]|nr:TIM barrel protein [Acidobacteriota bacterium]
MSITRRKAVRSAAAFGILSGATKIGLQAEAASRGRLKQSVCKWCYKDLSIDELAAAGAKMGLRAIDLLTAEEWPLLEKYGLICSMGSGICTIPDGLNQRANHAEIEANFRRLLPLAKKHNVPNLICFSGNRRDISDAEAWDNCAALLRKVTPQAEDLGVTIAMELLNSKVNHPDYQCDTTPWGVELAKRVDSPRFTLLYDIYHMQIMEGDVIRTIQDNPKFLGHFHTGGNPGRHEIDATQELNYTAIAKAVADTGFEGYFAHEFIPVRDPLTSLREAVRLCTV